MTFYLILYLNYLCLFVSSNTKKNGASNQQITSSKASTIPRQQGIDRRRKIEKSKISLKDTSRGTSFSPSQNNKLFSPPSCVGSKRKSGPEEKSNEKLPGILLFINWSLMMIKKLVTWVVVIVLWKTTHSLNMIVIPIMAMWVVDMFYKQIHSLPMWIFKFI